MGASPYGILYYGFPLPEEEVDTWKESGEDWDWKVNTKWRDEHCPPQPKSTYYLSPEWDTWRDEENKFRLSNLYIEVDWSGSDYGQTYFIHCKSEQIYVEWEEQVAVFPTNDRDIDESIRMFCERFGFEYRQPYWHLAARYF